MIGWMNFEAGNYRDNTAIYYFRGREKAPKSGQPLPPLWEIPDNGCLADYMTGDEIFGL